jgi:hypothetical protein
MRFLQKIKSAIGIFVCLAVFSASDAQAQKLLLIQNDAGGVVRDYVINANLAELRGEAVQVTGWCASACTAYLGNPGTCVTPSASFGFHGPSGGTAEENRRAALVLARQLPEAIQGWYLREAVHLKGRAHIVVSAAQLVWAGAARWC